MMACRPVRHSHGHADISVGPMRREGFLAVQNPVSAIESSSCLGSAGVAAGFRFRKTPGAELLSLSERYGKFPALILSSKTEDVTRAERIVCCDRDTNRAVHSR